MYIYIYMYSYIYIYIYVYNNRNRNRTYVYVYSQPCGQGLGMVGPPQLKEGVFFSAALALGVLAMSPSFNARPRAEQLLVCPPSAPSLRYVVMLISLLVALILGTCLLGCQ